IMNAFDPARPGSHLTHGGTFNGNPVNMVAGYESMAMLTPDEFDRLAGLGQRVRDGLANIIEARGLSWQITGQASLFKLHGHPRKLVDYRKSTRLNSSHLVISYAVFCLKKNTSAPTTR